MEEYRQIAIGIFVFQLIIRVFTSLTPSQNGSFTLGSNLVQNSNLTAPILPNNVYSKLFSLYQAGWSTKVKYVLFVLSVDLIPTNPFICPVFHGANAGEQFLSMDTFFSNQYYYQNISLGGMAEFYISLDHMSGAPNNPLSTGISIWWNGNKLDTIFESDCTLRSSGYYVFSQIGINQLAIKGQGIADCISINIRNIQLRQVLYANSTGEQLEPLLYNSTNLLSLLNNNEILLLQQLSQKLISSLWALNKNTAKFVLGYFLEFNHLMLFNYYQGNISCAFSVIINSMQTLENQKGALIDSYIYSNFGTSSQQIFNLFASNNNILPSSVAYNTINSFLPNRSNSFLLSLTDFLVWDMSLAICTFILGLFIFKVLFNFRISKLFRSYSFTGYIFIIFFDGKIEILTFEFLSQFLMPFSKNYTNKWLIVAMLVFYFVIFFYSVGGMILIYIFYKKKAKYFYENAKISLSSVVFMFYTAGIFNLTLGAAHRLLVYSPSIQIITIICLECSYIFYYVFHIISRKYETAFLSFIIILMSSCRLLLYLFLLVPSKQAQIFENFIEILTFIIFQISLGLIYLSIFIFFLRKGCLIIKIIKSFASHNKSYPSKQKIHLDTTQNTNQVTVFFRNKKLWSSSKQKQPNRFQRFIIMIKLRRKH